MRNHFNKGIFVAILSIGSILFLIPSCEKTSIADTQNHAEIFENYKSTLYKDEDFIKNFEIDQALTSFNKSKHLTFNEQKANILSNAIAVSKSNQDIEAAFSAYGSINASALVKLFNLKANALINIQKKYPALSQLSKEEFTNLFISSYKSVVLTTQLLKHREGCSTNCCDAYVDGISDCDTDFAIGTGFALIGAGIATITGTPIAGAAAVSAGIGSAYLSHTRCASSAARTYRQCMGYE